MCNAIKGMMNGFYFRWARIESINTYGDCLCLSYCLAARQFHFNQSVLARDDLMPTNAMKMFSLHSIMSSTQDISRIPSVYIHHIPSGKMSHALPFILVPFCWLDTLRPMGNEKLILFPTSNVVIRFEVQHSNCLSKSHSSSKHQTHQWLRFDTPQKKCVFLFLVNL